MCDNCCKIKAYLGFAKKSRNIIYGVDDIIRLKNKCQLVIISSSLAESSFEKLKTNLQKNNISVVVLNEEKFIKNLDSENIKAIAITDKNLSDAIKNQLD